MLSPNNESIYGDVKRVRQQIAESAMPKLELHFTEWSSSYTPADPIHDSYHSAAYILDKLKNCGDAAQSMSYWMFTDIFEEAGPRWTPFHGGFGLINYQDINKPAFYAYQFLNRLGPTELKNSDPASWICTDTSGGMQALVWDFTNTHPGTNINQPGLLQTRPAVLAEKQGHAQFNQRAGGRIHAGDLQGRLPRQRRLRDLHGLGFARAIDQGASRKNQIR